MEKVNSAFSKNKKGTGRDWWRMEREGTGGGLDQEGTGGGLAREGTGGGLEREGTKGVQVRG